MQISKNIIIGNILPEETTKTSVKHIRETVYKSCSSNAAVVSVLVYIVIYSYDSIFVSFLMLLLVSYLAVDITAIVMEKTKLAL